MITASPLLQHDLGSTATADEGEYQGKHEYRGDDAEQGNRYTLLEAIAKIIYNATFTALCDGLIAL